MITPELAKRYYLPEKIEDYPMGELEYFRTFLAQTDYVANKIAEAAYLGEALDEDYTDVLQARKYARQRINELS